MEAIELTILYKNAARSSHYVDCTLTRTSHAATTPSMPLSEALHAFETFDCLLPYGSPPPSSSDLQVIPCTIEVLVCNGKGNPVATLAQPVAPDLYFRTDRGAWSVFHEHTVILVPKVATEPFSIQFGTRERSNVMKAVMVAVLRPKGKGGPPLPPVAQSSLLLVLSKPPSTIGLPFVQVRRITNAASSDATSTKLDTSSRCSPSKWLDYLKPETHRLVGVPPTSRALPWIVHSLGRYRRSSRSSPVHSAAITAGSVGHKRPRDDFDEAVAKDMDTKSDQTLKDDDDDVYKPASLIPSSSSLAAAAEVQSLRTLVEELQAKLSAVEAQKDGLAKALRLLSSSS